MRCEYNACDGDDPMCWCVRQDDPPAPPVRLIPDWGKAKASRKGCKRCKIRKDAGGSGGMLPAWRSVA